MSADSLRALIDELATGPSTARRREIVSETRVIIAALANPPSSKQPSSSSGANPKKSKGAN